MTKLFKADSWLRYVPHEQFVLPRLRESRKPAILRYREETKEIPLYRLAWPGQDYRLSWDRPNDPQDNLPQPLLSQWAKKGEATGIEGKTVVDWLREGPFPGGPHTWPEQIQYHIAANWDAYAEHVPDMPKVPVQALPHDIVQRIFKMEFAVDEKYEATIRYLDWVGCAMRKNPLLDGHFDTAIRDSLMEVSTVCIQKYFMMIGDCVFDSEEQSWSRDPLKRVWHKLAAYLWWVGRTGRGLYEDHAGVGRRHKGCEAYSNPEEAMDAWQGGVLASGIGIIEQLEALSVLLYDFDTNVSHKNSALPPRQVDPGFKIAKRKKKEKPSDE